MKVEIRSRGQMQDTLDSENWRMELEVVGSVPNPRKSLFTPEFAKVAIRIVDIATDKTCNVVNYKNEVMAFERIDVMNASIKYVHSGEIRTVVRMFMSRIALIRRSCYTECVVNGKERTHPNLKKTREFLENLEADSLCKELQCLAENLDQETST